MGSRNKVEFELSALSLSLNSCQKRRTQRRTNERTSGKCESRDRFVSSLSLSHFFILLIFLMMSEIKFDNHNNTNTHTR